MRELVLYLFTFILVYLFYFVFVLNRKNVLSKMPEGKEMKYLKYRYGVKVTKDNLKKVANAIFFANAFILSTTVYVVCLFNNLIYSIIFGMIVLIILILVIYHLLGVYFRGGK